MAIKIPSNQIIASKYTIGKELIVESTYKNYQGYYYEFNSSYYAGKEFSTKAPKLIKVTSDKVNVLKNNPNTSVYGNLSKTFLPLNDNKIVSIPFSYNEGMRYFIKKVNDSIIKEISKQTFEQFNSNPIYQTLSFNFTYSITQKELTELDKKMPGIKDYVQYDLNNIPASSDEANPFVS
jgi:hypothetical protein